MHRLAGPLVRVRRPKIASGLCQRSTATLSLPFLLPANEARITPRREANIAKEPTVHSVKHELSPTYFDTRHRSLVSSGGEPKSVVFRLRQALDQRNVSVLHIVYAELRAEAIQLKDSSYATSHTRAQSLAELKIEDIRAAMELLLEAGTFDAFLPKTIRSDKMREDDRPRRSAAQRALDGKLAQHLFSDMSDIFGFAQDRRDCKRFVLGCAMQTSSSQEVLDHLVQLRGEFQDYEYSNYVREGTAILNLCTIEADGLQIAQQFWNFLERVGAKIHKDTRDQFLHLLFKAGNVPQAIDIVQNSSPNLRIFPLSEQKTSSLCMFLEGMARAGQGRWKPAVKLIDEVLERAARDKSSVPLTCWNSLLRYVGIAIGSRDALKMVQKGQKERLLQADDETFNLLLLTHESRLRSIARSGTEEDVTNLFNDIEASCSFAPPSASFTVAIHAILGLGVPSLFYGAERQSESYSISTAEGGLESQLDRMPTFSSRRSVPKYTPGQIHEASLLCQRLQARGLQPASALVNSMIVAYTGAYIPQVDKALELYQYWRSFGRRLQTGIYNILLFACAKAKNLTAAQQIIQDMISLGVSLNQRALSDLVVLLMEASYSYESAHEIYTSVRDAAEQLGGSALSKQKLGKVSVFDETGWLKIVDRYSKLQFDQGSLPPIGNILEIFIDMRASGFAPEPKQYTSLLQLYGRTATATFETLHSLNKNDKEGRGQVFSKVEQIREAIRTIHDFLQREETIEPDLILITCLMDAYNRVGRSQYALEIWHRLVLNKTNVDSACIAVVLDTCGHAGLIHEARRAWRWVQRDEFHRKQCVKKVWDAWIECLARCGYLLEAIDTAFLEMREALKDAKEGPDAMTMEMLLRFASSEKHRWNRDSNEEYYLLDHLKKRLQAEMPDVWDQIKNIRIPL